MIDPIARQRLAADRQQKQLIQSLQPKTDPDMDSLMGAPFKEVLRLAARKDGEKAQSLMLDKIGQALVRIYGKIPGSLNLPKIFQVQGNVTARILDMPPVTVQNLSELGVKFDALDSRLKQMATAISMIAAQGPQEVKVNQQAFDPKPFVDAMKEVTISVDGGGSSNQDVLGKLQEIAEGIAALYNRPQMTTAPATHVSVNALNGPLKTTQIQLGSTITALPVLPLTNRRSLQIYNNGSNTIYLGGSTVTTTTGIPVPSGSYSDGFDFGVNVLLYGVSQTGQNNDIRVLEVSDEGSGR